MAERAIAKQGLDEIGIDEELPSVFSSSEDVGEAVPPAAPPIPPVAHVPLGDAVDQPNVIDFVDHERVPSLVGGTTGALRSTNALSGASAGPAIATICAVRVSTVPGGASEGVNAAARRPNVDSRVRRVPRSRSRTCRSPI
ncbi:MAG TPA: hypothetical protein VKP64_00720 [Mycobacteriales bacterium]|nr:hypothetical protein [Mycobacteriales bacterium]